MCRYYTKIGHPDGGYVRPCYKARSRYGENKLSIKSLSLLPPSCRSSVEWQIWRVNKRRQLLGDKPAASITTLAETVTP